MYESINGNLRLSSMQARQLSLSRKTEAWNKDNVEDYLELWKESNEVKWLSMNEVWQKGTEKR